MPQLDFSIIFTQIFWLCILFSFFYFILVFYLLPNFLVSLKLRKFILEENGVKLSSVSSSIFENKNLFKKNINSQLESLYVNFESIDSTLKNSQNFSSNNIDSKLIKSTSQVILFCDSIIFKNICFYPKVFTGLK
uniref:ATP synthase F0 subunit 8 n=1 Tax=Campylaephora sungminbooi TaxID=1896769 RepID=UPI002E78C8D2|nr:ATP synthase F0 subunit 8 [Campylaephora sungminbooi]WQF69664.1 ATP synthase F0 subunit 8 [Campylaephora sungminbooi]